MTQPPDPRSPLHLADQSVRPPAVPAPTPSRFTPLLLGVVGLSLLPALALTAQRVAYEKSQKTAALVMDYPALVTQAKRYGQTPQQLLDRYKALGVNGVAVYEDTIGSLQQRGEIFLKNGYDLMADNPALGLNPASVYMRGEPGLVESLRRRYSVPTRNVTIAGQPWVEWPTDPTYLPAGPDNKLIGNLKAQGLALVYRPYYDAAVPVNKVGTDWPDVPFIAFTDDEVIGARTPELLAQVDRAMGKRLPAIIEGNIQKGLDTLVLNHGGARLFAVAPSWQNALDPLDVASKYNLAARERAQRLLYLRPYPTINETEAMLTRTRELLQKSGVQLTTPQISFYNPNPLLQALSLVGPLAALLLLGLSLPLRRLGQVLAGLTALAAFGLNALQPFAGAALVAAVTFPALGLVLRRERVTDWFIATALSLVGVVFVSALGATHNSTLGLEPFRGVGLTLLLPLLLVAASFLPRQDIRKTVSDIYSAPIKLGDILVMGLGLGLLMMVFERRGNATGGSTSQFEASLRRDIQDTIVRPRFKEVGAHPLAILGLSGKLPGYFSALMLLGGVMGQASVLNTFSHFHTPFLISAARCFLGLGIGLVVGLLLTALVGWIMKWWQRQSQASDSQTSQSQASQSQASQPWREVN